jgi:hypothetical protein
VAPFYRSFIEVRVGPTKGRVRLPGYGVRGRLHWGAVHAGFSEQSQFCRQFKRLAGVTPGQFRMPARFG